MGHHTVCHCLPLVCWAMPVWIVCPYGTQSSRFFSTASRSGGVRFLELFLTWGSRETPNVSQCLRRHPVSTHAPLGAPPRCDLRPPLRRPRPRGVRRAACLLSFHSPILSLTVVPPGFFQVLWEVHLEGNLHTVALTRVGVSFLELVKHGQEL